MASHLCTLPEGVQYWEANGLKDLIRSSKIVQKHDEETMVRKLVEISMSVFVILNEHV